MPATKVFASILTLVVIALLVFLAATVHLVFAQEDDEVELDGPGVITIDQSDSVPIKDAVRSIIQGTRIDGECVINYRMSIGADEQPKIARTLAFNPDTCEELIEQGTLASGDGPAEENDPQETGVPVPQPGTSSSQQAYNSASASSLPTKTKTFKATWEDPIQLDVNWQKTTIKWRYDAQNNTVQYVSGKCRWWWLTLTGWTADSDKECWHYPKDNGSQHVVEASRGFTNNVFVCSLPPPYPVPYPYPILQGAKTRMDNQTVTAYANGSYTGDVDFSKSGDCAWLLHSETRWE